MALAEAFLGEWNSESKTTRRVLERVPESHLTWKPHAKSMSLGQLALHLAQSPGAIADWAMTDVTDLSNYAGLTEAKSHAEILDAHDAGDANVRRVLGQLGDAGLTPHWKAVAGGNTIMEMSKVTLFRAIVLNHTYHHRGQLSVYLRLLDVPVPSIYGPSADEGRA